MSMGKSSIASILLHSVSSCIGVAIGIGISSIESNLEIYIITGKKYKKYKHVNLLLIVLTYCEKLLFYCSRKTFEIRG